MLRNGVTIPESASILALWQPENFPQIFRRMNKPNLILPMANLAKTLSCHCFFWASKRWSWLWGLPNPVIMYNNRIILYTDLYVYIYIYIHTWHVLCTEWLLASPLQFHYEVASWCCPPYGAGCISNFCSSAEKTGNGPSTGWNGWYSYIYIHIYVHVFVLFVVCYRWDIMYMTYRYTKILIVYSLYTHIYIS